MAIAAQRFKMLDKQTNVATTDFQSASSSDIFNSPNMAFKDLTTELQSFLKSDIQVPKIDVAAAKDKLARAGKDALGTIKDVGALSGKDIDKAIESLMAGFPQAQGLFSKMGPKCQTKGLSSGGLGKPYDTDINCGGKSRKGKKTGCNGAEYGNVLNKLTGGAYNATHTDLNKALTSLMALSKMGYDMNLCGVFSALSGGLDNNVLSRASGALLAHLGSSSNVLGVFDLAGASGGLHTLIENPSGISNVFKNFKMPEEIKQGSLSDFSDRLTGSMEMFSDSWNASGYDGMLSTGFSDVFNPEVNDVFQAKQLNYTFGEELNAPAVDDMSFMATAYSMNNNSNMMDFAV